MYPGDDKRLKRPKIKSGNDPYFKNQVNVVVHYSFKQNKKTTGVCGEW